MYKTFELVNLTEKKDLLRASNTNEINNFNSVFLKQIACECVKGTVWLGIETILDFCECERLLMILYNGMHFLARWASIKSLMLLVSEF
jgi:hypothetical protein